MSEQDARNVYQRKLAVMKRCSEIAPDKTHPHHRFEYVSIQNISNHMRRFLTEEGLDVEFSFEVEGKVLVSLVNVDIPEQRIDTFWPIVPDDKGYAYTTKFPLIRLFQIGDGEEGDESELATKSGQAASRPPAPNMPAPPPPNPAFQRLVQDAAKQTTSSHPRGQAAPGPAPSTISPSPVRGPAPAPVPGTPRSSGNLLTLQRPAKQDIPQDIKQDAELALRDQCLSLAVDMGRLLNPDMSEVEAMDGSRTYLDQLSQKNYDKNFGNLTQDQLKGFIAFLKVKIGQANQVMA